MALRQVRFVTERVTGCDRKFLPNSPCGPSIGLVSTPQQLLATPVTPDAECGSYPAVQPEISKIGWGGARANSGGARPGAGRRCKAAEPERAADIFGLRWYAVETEFRAEYDVYAAISNLGFRCHLPRFVDRSRKLKRYPRRPIIALVFAGFVLVEFDRSGMEWRRIPSLAGVSGLLGTSTEHPTAARIGEVERLIALGRAGDGVIDDDATPFPTGRARKDQMVRIDEGAFASFVGICTWSDKARLRILTDIFGCSATVELRHDQVTVI
jgi:transcription antitermination factor NusG